MDHVRSEHAEPIAAARRQQANPLEPKTDQEIQLVNWLANQVDLQRLHVLIELWNTARSVARVGPGWASGFRAAVLGRPANGYDGG
jgi:hypothetical protein